LGLKECWDITEWLLTRTSRTGLLEYHFWLIR